MTFGFILGTALGRLAGSPLRSDEEVMFFPATARLVSPERAELGVEAWVYEPERRPGVTTLFRRYLKLDPDTLNAEENAEFRRRVRLFLNDAESGKVLPLRVTSPLAGAAEPQRLPRTEPTGRTAARLEIPAPADPGARWIEFETKGPKKTFTGRALLVPAAGLSVVSDIDDTIKDTHVLVRREMLLNTFARPLRAVPGMAAVYRRVQDRDAATRFHYVSGGPHQLWPMLEEFLRTADFPEGSVHLRSIDWRKEIFGDGPGTQGHKLAVIRGLLRDFPRRRFVLVGDSGEKDPEVYGEIAREFPAQVVAIHIRDVTGEPRDAARYAEVFRDVPAERWSLFTEPGTIAFPTVPEASAP